MTKRIKYETTIRDPKIQKLDDNNWQTMSKVIKDPKDIYG
jgi:hypothetical protein